MPQRVSLTGIKKCHRPKKTHTHTHNPPMLVWINESIIISGDYSCVGKCFGADRRWCSWIAVGHFWAFCQNHSRCLSLWHYQSGWNTCGILQNVVPWRYYDKWLYQNSNSLLLSGTGIQPEILSKVQISCHHRRYRKSNLSICEYYCFHHSELWKNVECLQCLKVIYSVNPIFIIAKVHSRVVLNFV